MCVVQHTRGDPPRPLSTRHCVCGPPTYMSSMLSSWARSDMRDGIRLSLWLPIGLQIQAGYKGTLGPTGAPHWSATIRVGTRLHNEQPLADRICNLGPACFNHSARGGHQYWSICPLLRADRPGVGGAALGQGFVLIYLDWLGPRL